MSTHTNTVIDNLSREEIVQVLEGPGGYQCYDSESTSELRECLRTDIARGILPESILPE